ncbi:MAG: hypothetical protein R3B68_07020 [Phycisphaerales bacterium]
MAVQAAMGLGCALLFSINPVLSIAALLLIAVSALAMSMEYSAAQGACHNCGYSLASLEAEVCPECGSKTT